MTKEELATRLNEREYGSEITDDEAAEAKLAGLVVLYGASDDLAELRGAIDDEIGVINGGEFVLLDGKVYEFEQCECVHAEAADKRAREWGALIEAVWDDEVTGYAWSYKTKIEHATFDVFEDGEPFCRGIVFELP